jgi:hypothetical protein
MSLVFSAIVPHSPILLPTIGKDDLQKLKKTEAALKKLEEDFYLSKPDIVIIISPHGHLLKESFTFNMCAEFTTDLKDFGDLATKLTFKGESALWGYNGAIMAKALPHGDAIVYGSIQPQLTRSKSFNSVNDIFRDRRPEMYV